MKNAKNTEKQSSIYEEIKETLDGMSMMSKKISEELGKVFQ
jgi:hypothetical protein